MKQEMSTILGRRLTEIEGEIVKLAKERDEIKAALSVLARYAGGKIESVSPDHEPAGSRSEGTPRPGGIPTVWEMTSEYLRANRSATAKNIVDFIRERYWPGVVHAQIGPSLYRFVKEGRLKKIGRGEFSLPPHENSGSAEPEEAKAESASDTFSFHNPKPVPQGTQD